MKTKNSPLFAAAWIFFLAQGTAVAQDDSKGEEPAPKAPLPPAEKAEPGALQVESNPPGAAVLVAADDSSPGEEVGPAPILEDAAPGIYWVTLKMDGHEEVTVKVEVRPGEKTIVRASLARVQSSYGTKRIAGHSLLWPGIGAVVAEKRSLGNRVIVGANSVVLADVPSGTKVLGVWH